MKTSRREEARFLFLRLSYKEGNEVKGMLVTLHAIFWRDQSDGHWYGKCLETDKILVFDRTDDRVQWKMADSVMAGIDFARKHGILNESFRAPSQEAIKRWKAMRKREGLSVVPPDIKDLEFKDLYPAKKPKTGTRTPIRYLGSRHAFYAHT